MSGTVLGVIIAVLGLLTMVIRYLMKRNSKKVIEAESIKEALDNAKKANIAGNDPSYDDELRNKYKSDK